MSASFIILVLWRAYFFFGPVVRSSWGVIAGSYSGKVRFEWGGRFERNRLDVSEGTHAGVRMACAPKMRPTEGQTNPVLKAASKPPFTDCSLQQSVVLEGGDGGGWGG